MGISRLGRAAACTIGVSLALLASSPVAASADQWGRPVATGRSLAPGTRFFVPAPAKGSFAQIVSLLRSGDRKDAMLLAAMEATPQAVWFTGTNPSGSEQTPDQVAWAVRRTLLEARSEQAVPVMVIYNIPGRDCAQYSSGGAPTDAAYQAWVSGFAHDLGDAMWTDTEKAPADWPVMVTRLGSPPKLRMLRETHSKVLRWSLSW